jgi:hypothetical protein
MLTNRRSSTQKVPVLSISIKTTCSAIGMLSELISISQFQSYNSCCSYYIFNKYKKLTRPIIHVGQIAVFIQIYDGYSGNETTLTMQTTYNHHPLCYLKSNSLDSLCSLQDCYIFSIKLMFSPNLCYLNFHFITTLQKTWTIKNP